MCNGVADDWICWSDCEKWKICFVFGHRNGKDVYKDINFHKVQIFCGKGRKSSISRISFILFLQPLTCDMTIEKLKGEKITNRTRNYTKLFVDSHQLLKEPCIVGKFCKTVITHENCVYILLMGRNTCCSEWNGKMF